MKTFDGGGDSFPFTDEMMEEAKKQKLNIKFVDAKPYSHTFACGCVSDESTGIPISTCRRHDIRTREVKASAALMQMANCLDEAGPGADESYHRVMLREAAKYAVKAAKALIGSDTE